MYVTNLNNSSFSNYISGSNTTVGTNWTNSPTTGVTFTTGQTRYAGKSLYQSLYANWLPVQQTAADQQRLIEILARRIQKTPSLRRVLEKGGEWNYDPQRNVFHWSDKHNPADDFTVSGEALKKVIEDLPPKNGPKQKKKAHRLIRFI